MNIRVTLALLVVAAALGGYIWWVELPRAERAEEVEAAEQRIVGTDEDARPNDHGALERLAHSALPIGPGAHVRGRRP